MHLFWFSCWIENSMLLILQILSPYIHCNGICILHNVIQIRFALPGFATKWWKLITILKTDTENSTTIKLLLNNRTHWSACLIIVNCKILVSQISTHNFFSYYSEYIILNDVKHIQIRSSTYFTHIDQNVKIRYSR